MRRTALPLLALLCTSGLPSLASPLPQCVQIGGGETSETALSRAHPLPAELLARLVYAEGLSTGFPEDRGVYRAIAWGVMNRVRLGEVSATMRRRYGEGVWGVIFRTGQFNPAVSSRSRFSGDFLCPKHPRRWRMAQRAAREALTGQGNPFIETDWEKAHGLSLVVNFYYPGSTQARGPLPPWEGSPELALVAEVSIGAEILPRERIRFYRLTKPPGDVEGQRSRE